jgi:hypothetical protein
LLRCSISTRAQIDSLCLPQQYQKDNALISSLFIVYAPLERANELNFTHNLPLYAITHPHYTGALDVEYVDDDLMPKNR